MSKKATERLLKRFRENVERFSPKDESLTRAEVQDALRAAGTDPGKLRQWLNATARGLANAQRAKGKPAPDYLQRIVDVTGAPEELPKDEQTALQKAREWIRSLTAGPGPLTGDLEIIRAYRSRGEVSEEDRRALDAAEERLRKRLETKSDA
jgi:hypothetical protein